MVTVVKVNPDGTFSFLNKDKVLPFKDIYGVKPQDHPSRLILRMHGDGNTCMVIDSTAHNGLQYGPDRVSLEATSSIRDYPSLLTFLKSRGYVKPDADLICVTDRARELFEN